MKNTSRIYLLFVQLPSCVQLFVIPWTVACQASLSFTISWSLLNFKSTELVIQSNHIILRHPLSFCLPSFPAWGSFPMSQFALGGQSIRVLASASVIPMNLPDWFPLGLTGLILQSKGLSKSLLQPHSSKASILRHLAFSIGLRMELRDIENHSQGTDWILIK